MKTTIGERLKKFRQSTGLSAEEISKIIGGSQSAFSKNENDKTKPGADTLIGLYEKFQIDPLWILTGENRNTEIKNPTALKIGMIADQLSDKAQHRILEQIERELLLESILQNQSEKKAASE